MNTPSNNEPPNVEVPPETLAAIDTHLEALLGLVSTLPTLTKAQISRFVKLGNRSRGFVEDSVVLSLQNPDVIPRGIDLSDVTRRSDLNVAFNQRLFRLEQVAARYKEIGVLISSGHFAVSRGLYKMLSVYSGKPALKPAIDRLRARFKQKLTPEKKAERKAGRAAAAKAKAQTAAAAEVTPEATPENPGPAPK